MTQNACAYSDQQKQADAELAFKRFILEKTLPFERTPKADLFRVALLGMMFDQYDGFLKQGLVAEAARERTKQAFYNIQQRMEEAGFDRVEEGAWQEDGSDEEEDWPQFSEQDVTRYLDDSKDFLKSWTRSIVMFVSFLGPALLGMGLTDIFPGLETVFMGMGMLSSIGMLTLGIINIVTTPGVKNRGTVRTGSFSLTVHIREKLEKMLELMEEKCRRRRARGIGIIASSFIPTIAAQMLGGVFYQYADGFFSIAVAILFGMVGAGVHQILMSGEKKALYKLLKK